MKLIRKPGDRPDVVFLTSPYRGGRQGHAATWRPAIILDVALLLPPHLQPSTRTAIVLPIRLVKMEEGEMSTTAATTKQREHTLEKNLWAALSAALLGLVILYGVGFAPLQAHNAAHDARHSAAFPCH